MATVYSTYEAKTRFSELLRKVRGGESVLVSYHGRTVAEIRPIEEEQTFEERLDRLEAEGLLPRQSIHRRPKCSRWHDEPAP